MGPGCPGWGQLPNGCRVSGDPGSEGGDQVRIEVGLLPPAGRPQPGLSLSFLICKMGAVVATGPQADEEECLKRVRHWSQPHPSGLD